MSKLTTILVAVALLASMAGAADYTWTGGGANDYWSNTANWDLGAVPGSSDKAIFGLGGTVTVDSAQSIGAIDVNTAGLTINGSNVLTFAAGATFTSSVSVKFEINAAGSGTGTLMINGGEFSLHGNNTGSLSGAVNAIVVAPGACLNIGENAGGHADRIGDSTSIRLERSKMQVQRDPNVSTPLPLLYHGAVDAAGQPTDREDVGQLTIAGGHTLIQSFPNYWNGESVTNISGAQLLIEGITREKASTVNIIGTGSWMNGDNVLGAGFRVAVDGSGAGADPVSVNGMVSPWMYYATTQQSTTQLTDDTHHSFLNYDSTVDTAGDEVGFKKAVFNLVAASGSALEGAASGDIVSFKSAADHTLLTDVVCEGLKIHAVSNRLLGSKSVQIESGGLMHGSQDAGYVKWDVSNPSLGNTVDFIFGRGENLCEAVILGVAKGYGGLRLSGAIYADGLTKAGDANSLNLLGDSSASLFGQVTIAEGTLILQHGQGLGADNDVRVHADGKLNICDFAAGAGVGEATFKSLVHEDATGFSLDVHNNRVKLSAGYAGNANTVEQDIVAGRIVSTSYSYASPTTTVPGADGYNTGARRIGWVTTASGTTFGYAAPGDSNMDGQVSSADLLLASPKYNLAAGNGQEWGNGDWNYDGVVNSADLLDASPNYNAGIYAATTPGASGDGSPTIIYDAATGEMTVVADGVSGIDSFIIASASGILTGDTPAFFAYGGFLTDTDNEISHMFFGPAMVGTDVKSLGNVAATGQTEAFLLSDLTLLGGISGSDSIEFDLAYVPEPATMTLLALGGLALIRRRRRK